VARVCHMLYNHRTITHAIVRVDGRDKCAMFVSALQFEHLFLMQFSAQLFCIQPMFT
jgi:hypothetical protein